jgi:hypothetical protein
MPNQEFYFKKAREFYYQRIESGKDDYENLSPPKQDSFPKNYERDSLNLLIFIELSDGQSKKVRANINIYFKKYGMNKRLILYYILSLLPSKLITILRRIF